MSDSDDTYAPFDFEIGAIIGNIIGMAIGLLFLVLFGVIGIVVLINFILIQ